PATTIPGLLISSLSLSFMFFLWRAKKTVALRLNSSTLLKDAACARVCLQLSGVLFAGSLLFLFSPDLWWIDAAAAIGIAALTLREGWETIEAARNPEFTGCCG